MADFDPTRIWPAASHQHPPQFRAIQVSPKDPADLRRQAYDAAKELPLWLPACCYDRRRHPWEGGPCSASGGANSSR